MKWKDDLQRILRWPAAAVSGLATAGLIANGPAADQPAAPEGGREPDGVVLPNTLNANAEDLFAAHGSHRSHRSHSSHGSHRSSSGSRRSIPIPSPSESGNALPAPQNPARQPPAADTSMMVVRVQAALMRRGHYQGDIDGVLGEGTRTALRAFQKENGINQTGRMDIETHTLLGIPIP